MTKTQRLIFYPLIAVCLAVMLFGAVTSNGVALIGGGCFAFFIGLIAEAVMNLRPPEKAE